MGSAQSLLGPEVLSATVVLVGMVVVGYFMFSQTPVPPSEATAHEQSGSEGRKGKKKKVVSERETAPGPSSSKEPTSPQPTVVKFPTIIPGDFDPSLSAIQDDPPTKPKKGKKKKGKGVAGKETPKQADADQHSSDVASPPSTETPSKLSRQSSAKPQPSNSAASIDTDGSWTRVESRRQKARQENTSGTEGQISADLTTSDAGVTTSATGNSSPTNDRTEDEAHIEIPSGSGKKKTLAEKLLPKPKKTGVDECVHYLSPHEMKFTRYTTLHQHVRDARLPGALPRDADQAASR
jgi:hypothetical protein